MNLEKTSVFKLFTFVPTIPKYIRFCSKCVDEQYREQ